MKKIRKLCAGLLAPALLLLLAACGSAGETGTTGATGDAAVTENTDEAEAVETVENASQSVKTANTETLDTESSGMESANVPESAAVPLVIFFSRTGEQYNVGVIEKGNTAIVAEMIIEETGADSFELKPADDYYPYTYQELTDVAKKEQSENARPAYAGEVPDLSKYSTIYLGSPVWWGDFPMLYYTFFEENADALAGKTLIPFSTHGGSGLAGFDTKLAAVCPDSTIGKGLAIAGTDAQNDPEGVRASVQAWLAGE